MVEEMLFDLLGHWFSLGSPHRVGSLPRPPPIDHTIGATYT